MKKLAFVLACMFTLFATSLRADDDRPITLNELPAVAQQFLKTHFADAKVLLVKMESGLFDKNYEVQLRDGQKLEFDRKGAWTEVDGRKNAVPAAIVPGFISKYVADTWPEAKVVKIEKDDRHKEYEVELSNRMELKFNYKGALVEIDD